MSWIVIATGLGGAALLAMGSDMIIPIGYGIGRIGCFLNGCCYGHVASEDTPAIGFPVSRTSAATR